MPPAVNKLMNIALCTSIKTRQNHWQTGNLRGKLTGGCRFGCFCTCTAQRGRQRGNMALTETLFLGFIPHCPDSCALAWWLLCDTHKLLDTRVPSWQHWLQSLLVTTQVTLLRQKLDFAVGSLKEGSSRLCCFSTSCSIS